TSNEKYRKSSTSGDSVLNSVLRFSHSPHLSLHVEAVDYMHRDDNNDDQTEDRAEPRRRTGEESQGGRVICLLRIDGAEDESRAHRPVNELLTIKRVSCLCEFSTDGRMADLCPSQVNVFADLSRASRTCDQNVACTSACTRAGEQEGREQFRSDSAERQWQ
ncbi:hypothetical protein K0M31_008636, partial [Melipona bicolor]